MSTDRTAHDETSTASSRRVSTDVLVGVGLLATVVAGKIVWGLSDGSILAAIGAR